MTMADHAAPHRTASRRIAPPRATPGSAPRRTTQHRATLDDDDDDDDDDDGDDDEEDENDDDAGDADEDDDEDEDEDEGDNDDDEDDDTEEDDIPAKPANPVFDKSFEVKFRAYLQTPEGQAALQVSPPSCFLIS